MVPATEVEALPVRALIVAFFVVVLVVALAGVASPPVHAAATADVDVENYRFGPDDLVIDPGTTVTWTALEGDHTVTSEGGSFDELIAQDYSPHSFSYTFDKPGRYNYYCGFHAQKGMRAVVEVRDPSGSPTTVEQPTTTTAWSPPTTTTTTAPTTTTTAAPVTQTSAPAPTTTAPPTVSSAPPATSAVPVTTLPAAPPTTARSTPAGKAAT
ncbi:MAG: plastocyanin/azurin family copper-binding protein, partial [Acidimicrobiia bacterium]